MLLLLIKTNANIKICNFPIKILNNKINVFETQTKTLRRVKTVCLDVNISSRRMDIREVM